MGIVRLGGADLGTTGLADPILNQAQLTQYFYTARRHHRAGRLQQAEVLYRRILQVAPRHPQTLHLLGVLAHQTGHPRQAVELIQQASAASPHLAAWLHDEQLNPAFTTYQTNRLFLVGLKPNGELSIT